MAEDDPIDLHALDEALGAGDEGPDEAPDGLDEGDAGGELFGAGGPGSPPPRRPRPRAPFRGTAHWLDLPLNATLVFAMLAWVAAHPALTIEPTPGQGAVALADAPLELQWDLFLRDVVGRDVQADHLRPVEERQYDWAAWWGAQMPEYLQQASAPQVARAFEADRRRWVRGLAQTLRDVVNAKVPKEALLALANQMEQEDV